MDIKDKITHYWGQRAEAFGRLRLREWQSVKRERWEQEFDRYFPKGKQLCILDVGTGTGFFAFILAAGGHRVTGIDLTEEMIEGAKEAAKYLGLEAEFKVMDAEDPAFADESFDVIVTRNLTWTLPHLEDAYQRWSRLLKPGGLLLNFDGDYSHQKPVGELPAEHSHKEIAPELAEEGSRIEQDLTEYQIRRRPAWDVELLLNAGFEKIMIDNGIWPRMYAEKDEFYNPVPIFTIAAYKQERTEG